jgi:hypothetical protein
MTIKGGNLFNKLDVLKHWIEHKVVIVWGKGTLYNEWSVKMLFNIWDWRATIVRFQEKYITTIPTQFPPKSLKPHSKKENYWIVKDKSDEK